MQAVAAASSSGRAISVAGCAVATVVLLGGIPERARAAEGDRRLEATLEMSIDHDSNVARSTVILAQRGLTSRDDFIYGPNLRLNLNVPSGNRELFLRGDVGYRFYQYNTILNAQAVGLTGGLTQPFSRCQLAPVLGYDRRQTNLSDILIGPPKNVATTKSASLSVSCLVGRLRPTIAVDERSTRNTSTLATDTDIFSANAALGFDSGALGTISLVGHYSKADYRNQAGQFALVGREPNYDMYSTGFTYSRPIGARLSGTFGLQYYWLNSQISGGDQGLSGDAGLLYKIGPRLELSLNAARAVRPSTQLFATRSRDTTVDLEAHYRMSSRLRLTLGGHKLRRTYYGQLAPVLRVPSQERVSRAHAAATFDVSDKTSLSLSFSHEVKKTDAQGPQGFGYTSNEVVLTAARSF